MDNILSDDFVNDLFSCQKKIILQPSPKQKSNGQHKETGIELESLDGMKKFSVFIREHVDLIEFFSVGLVYIPDKGLPMIIARYNGDHGVHINRLTKEKIIGGCHIHRYKKECVELGINGDNHATSTDKYSTVNQALYLFFKDMNVVNFSEYYPELLQTEMFTQ